MILPLRSSRISRLAIPVVLAFLGCRDPEPSPMLFIDLGSEDRSLLPVPSAWHNPAVLGGQAEWVPFRPPGTPPTIETEQVPDEDVEAPAQEDQGGAEPEQK